MDLKRIEVDGEVVVGEDDIKEVVDVKRELEGLSETAMSMSVSDPNTYEEAAEFLRRVDALNKLVEGVIEPIRKKTYAHYKDVLGHKKSMLAPGEKASKHLRAQMTSYMEEQDRIKKEEERKRIAAAQEEARRQQEEEFDKAIDEGDELRAELALEKSDRVKVDVSDLEELTPDVDGISYRVNWSAELVDLKELCLAVAKGDVPGELVTFNQSKANQIARSLKEEMRVPGVKAVESKTLVRR